MKLTIPLYAAPLLAAFAYSPVSLAQFPACQSASSDSDNDGWGWENNRTCLVNNSAASTATTQNLSTQSVTTTNSGFPVCTSSAADEDGDGWGYEFNRSCRVTVATQTAAPATSVTTTPATSSQDIQNGLYLGRFPVCSDSSSDLDNDGWGYENFQSCYVVATTPADTPIVQPAGGTSGSPPVAAATAAPELNPNIINGLYEGRFQICTSASSDIDNDGWGYEFRQSCRVVEGYVDPNAAPSTPPAGNSPASSVGQIYSQNFADANLGLYQGDQLNADWETPIWHLGFDQGRVRIVDAGGRNGKAMEVTYPAGRYGAIGASAFLSDIQFAMGLPDTYEELYVAYDIRFANDFDFVRGGKLPGLCGASNNAAPSTGCNTGGGFPTGYDGWSARGMWRENGELESYIYHASQRNFFADDEFWNVRALRGVWHRVEHRIVLNTPGQRNGIIEAWFDGQRVLSLDNLEYRKDRSIGINLFYFSTFFGGNDPSWAPSSDQTMNFDNFVISTDKID